MKETKRLKGEIRALERDIRFLNDSRTRVENIFRSLGEFGLCNRYVNYAGLKMKAKEAVNHFYDIIGSQLTSGMQTLKTHYDGLIAKSNAEKSKAKGP